MSSYFNISENALRLVYASKESGGNPKSTAAHDKVDEAASLTQQAVTDLLAMLEKNEIEDKLLTGERVGRYNSGERVRKNELMNQTTCMRA